MSAAAITPPFPIFTDRDGQPLEAGYVWIGVENLPPQTNPQTVYWDEALTQPAAQPIRTQGGYPTNNSAPAAIYVDSAYSILAQDSRGTVVYSSLSQTGQSSIPFGSVGTAQISDQAVTTIKIADNAVTFAKLQTINTPRLLGRSTVGTGAVEQLSVGTGLSLTLGALSAAVASDTTQGVVELATTAEAVAGTDTTRAVTPAGLRAANNVRAWVNFVGGAAPVINGSSNVSSVTNLGPPGLFDVNFTTALPNANYAWVLGSRLTGSLVAPTFHTVRATDKLTISLLNTINTLSTWNSHSSDEISVVIIQ